MLLGVDIGGTKCAVVLATDDGELLARAAEPTKPLEREPREVLARLTSIARELMESAGGRSATVRAVGVSCGGPVDPTSGVVYSPPNLPGWEAVPVREILEHALELPVRVENDANATALAEWRFGAGRGTRNFVFMTMGTGIGAGLILDGDLYRGARGLAGEVGHQTIMIDGPVCACGKRGCLEALASGPAIARLARERHMYGRAKHVLRLAGGKPAQVTAAHVIEAAKAGDAFARNILTEAGTYMGVGVANVIQILNPERVALGTVAVHAGDLILEPIRSAVREFAWARSGEGCDVVAAALGDRAQDLAAIALVMDSG